MNFFYLRQSWDISFKIIVITSEYQSDGGDITDKEFLPVKQVRFGDTGSHLDEKKGSYTLGPLLCEGDGQYLL
jgi:hypothetical protein